MNSMNIDMEIWYVDLICVLTNFVLMNRHAHKFRKSIAYCHHEHFLIKKIMEKFFRENRINNIILPIWILKSVLRKKLLGHVGHTKGLSFLWTCLTWSIIPCLYLLLCEHTLHLNLLKKEKIINQSID